MEYHRNRFQDFSMLVYDEKSRLIAVVPANVVGNKVYSHNGLSYGGIVISQDLKLEKYISIYQSILQFLNENGIIEFFIKPIPQFYSNSPSEEINYLLFLTKGKLFRADSMATIDLKCNFKIDNNRKEGIKRGIKNQLVINEENILKSFWKQVLVPNMNEKHQLNPVHNLDEIQFLKNRFPENIKQYNVYQNDEIIAGTTLFVNKKVVHAQYISVIGNKNHHGAIDYLFHYLITDVYKDFNYFNFGNSNEESGTKLNKGLHYWKETFGARTYVQNFYKVETKNYQLLNHIFV